MSGNPPVGPEESATQPHGRGGAGNVASGRSELPEQLTAEAAVAALHAGGQHQATIAKAPQARDPHANLPASADAPDEPQPGESYLIGRGGGGNLVDGKGKDKATDPNGEEWKGWADILKERFFGK